MRSHRLLVLLLVLLAGGLCRSAAEDEGLVIVNAIWKGGIKEINVTSRLRERVHGETLEMPVDRTILGDPAKHEKKILRVTYRLHGSEHSLEVLEGRTLKIPPAAGDMPDTPTLTGDQREQIQRISDATKALNTPAKGLEIVQAVFGRDGFWRDVTSIVRESISDNKWDAEFHKPFPELGGDPVDGKLKHLLIGYRVDGVAKMGVFDEFNRNTIHVVLP